jgi:hypothetical protein
MTIHGIIRKQILCRKISEIKYSRKTVTSITIKVKWISNIFKNSTVEPTVINNAEKCLTHTHFTSKSVSFSWQCRNGRNRSCELNCCVFLLVRVYETAAHCSIPFQPRAAVFRCKKNVNALNDTGKVHVRLSDVKSASSSKFFPASVSWSLLQSIQAYAITEVDRKTQKISKTTSHHSTYHIPYLTAVRAYFLLLTVSHIIKKFLIVWKPKVDYLLSAPLSFTLP